MFSISGNDASNFLVLEKFSSLFARVWSFLPKFPVGKINVLVSIHLGTSNFEV